MQLCPIKKAFLTYLAQTSPSPPMYEFVKAKGIYLYDAQGKPHIDLISGIAVNNVGHRNPKVLKAIRKQLKRYLHQMVFGEYLMGPQVKLAERLAAVLPAELSATYVVNSGSEANEGAIKLARKATGRSKLIAIRGAYHGSSTGPLSLMSSAYYSSAFKPLLPEVYHIDLNAEDQLDLIDEATAAVFVEAVQAETGYLPATTSFLQAIRQRCTQTGALLVADEIQSGIGRTGSFCAFQRHGIVPDIVTLAKGLGGGMPIGAFVASKSLMEQLTDQPILGHITTFGGHPVSCAAAIATIDYLLDQGLMNSVAEKEAHFRQLLKHPLIRKISGTGLMLALHIDSFERVEQVIRHAFANGLIIDWFLYENRALRIAPPLTISLEEISKVCALLLSALDHSEH